MRMVYAIILVVGTTLLIISIVLFRQTLEFIKHGTRTTATVIEHEIISGKKGATYKPIFKFTTITNQEIIFKHHTSSSPASFDIGEEVPIVYNSDNPSNAKVLTYFSLFIWTILLMCLSMPLIVIGGGYFYTQQFLR